jgi:hypothetical protein
MIGYLLRQPADARPAAVTQEQGHQAMNGGDRSNARLNATSYVVQKRRIDRAAKNQTIGVRRRILTSQRSSSGSPVLLPVPN